MKLYSPLFIAVIVATCQANGFRLNPPLLARQGVIVQPSDKTYDELDPETLLIPNAYKPGYLRGYVRPRQLYAPYHNPEVRARLNPKALLHQQSEAAREAELTRIDREALSKISEEDRHLLLSKLSKADRQALLAKLEDVENRFGFTPPTGGFAATVSQIGAGAGGYIGGKLAGQLGAKLGAAAGAYLGAAAASRLESTVRGFGYNSAKYNNVKNIKSAKTNTNTNTSSDPNKRDVQHGYDGNVGAVLVKNK